MDSTSCCPVAPAVAYRLPILKRGHRNVKAPSKKPMNAAVPFPYPHENILIKGLLVDQKVHLFDQAAYNFLRFQRGFFGEFSCGLSNDPERAPTTNPYDSHNERFPPPEHISPVATLNLFEAYFLSYACGCLEVWDSSSGAAVLRQDLMRAFSLVEPLFSYLFAAYLHFRRKRYVVKSGLRFGTDFVLYEYGPNFTHSLYAVHVIVPGVRDPGLRALDAMQRVANAVKKDLLLVEVTWDDIFEAGLENPDCFRNMSISEAVVRRRETLTSIPEPGKMPSNRPVQKKKTAPSNRHQSAKSKCTRPASLKFPKSIPKMIPVVSQSASRLPP